MSGIRVFIPKQRYSTITCEDYRDTDTHSFNFAVDGHNLLIYKLIHPLHTTKPVSVLCTAYSRGTWKAAYKLPFEGVRE